MIRFTFKYLKPVALFLSIVVLFQCCVVYDKQPVSIDQAINKDHKKAKRIKIEMVDGQKLIVDSIYYKENDLYYSKKVEYREKIENSEFYRTKMYTAEVKIGEDKIVKIRLHNKEKSSTHSILLILGIPIVILVGGGFIALVSVSSWL